MEVISSQSGTQAYLLPSLELPCREDNFPEGRENKKAPPELFHYRAPPRGSLEEATLWDSSGGYEHPRRVGGLHHMGFESGSAPRRGDTYFKGAPRTVEVAVTGNLGDEC